jgi:hypothetical protein
MGANMVKPSSEDPVSGSCASEGEKDFASGLEELLGKKMEEISFSELLQVMKDHRSPDTPIGKLCEKWYDHKTQHEKVLVYQNGDEKQFSYLINPEAVPQNEIDFAGREVIVTADIIRQKRRRNREIFAKVILAEDPIPVLRTELQNCSFKLFLDILEDIDESYHPAAIEIWDSLERESVIDEYIPERYLQWISRYPKIFKVTSEQKELFVKAELPDFDVECLIVK